MSLDTQIKEARQALEELTADEAELDRLETEQMLQIDTLKGSGSKDFAALAELEGKRAALASMLSEQRAAIDRTRANLSSLTAAKEREDALLQIKATAAATREARDAYRAGRVAVVDYLAKELAVLSDLQEKRRTLRHTFQQQAAALGVEVVQPMGRGLELRREDQVYREEALEALFSELRELGADVEALRLHPGEGWNLSNVLDLPDVWPWTNPAADFYNRVPYWASFWTRLGMMSGDFIAQAEGAYHAANQPEAVRQRLKESGQVRG